MGTINSIRRQKTKQRFAESTKAEVGSQPPESPSPVMTAEEIAAVAAAADQAAADKIENARKWADYN